MRNHVKSLFCYIITINLILIKTYVHSMHINKHIEINYKFSLSN